MRETVFTVHRSNTPHTVDEALEFIGEKKVFENPQ